MTHPRAGEFRYAAASQIGDRVLLTATIIELAQQPVLDALTEAEEENAKLRTAVEILGSMVEGGHKMTPESQETMRAKAAGLVRDVLDRQEQP